MEKITINQIREEEMIEAVLSQPSDSTHHQAIVKAALGLHKTTLDAAKLTAVATSQKTAAPQETPPPSNTGGSGPSTWPVPDPNDSNPPSNLFNPDNINSNDSINTIYQDLYGMIQWMDTHPDNKTAMMDFMASMAKLSQISKFMSDPELLQMLNSPSLSSNGMSIFEFAGATLMSMYFYSDGTPNAQTDTENFCHWLASQFSTSTVKIDGIVTDSPFTGLVNYLNNMANPQNFKQWILKEQAAGRVGSNGLPAITYSQWCLTQGYQWGVFMNGTSNSGGQQSGGIDFGTFNQMYSNYMINSIIANAKGLSALQQAIIFLFMKADSDGSSVLGGYGDTAKWLNEQTGNANNALSGFTNGGFTSQSAMNWMQNLVGIQWGGQDTLAGGTTNLVNPQIESIMNITDPKTGETLGELYSSVPPKAADLAAALNSFQPSGSSTQPPPAYTLVTNSLKQIVGAYTDQSQVLTTIMTQKVNNQMTNDNTMTAALNNSTTGIAGFIGVCVNNQRPT